MGNSIQDYLRKINSALTFIDCMSFLVSVLFLGLLLLFLYTENKESSSSVSYYDSSTSTLEGDNEYSHPFASKNGKTYTFSWCQGANIISTKNKIYFDTESDAQKSGRTLSKLCQK